MIFANLEQGGRTAARLFPGWPEYHAATFSPETTPAAVIPLEISGRTYRERQNSLRNLAIDVQHADDGGLSWGELAVLGAFFEEQGRRYGLLREFRENAIC